MKSLNKAFELATLRCGQFFVLCHLVSYLLSVIATQHSMHSSPWFSSFRLLLCFKIKFKSVHFLEVPLRVAALWNFLEFDYTFPDKKHGRNALYTWISKVFWPKATRINEVVYKISVSILMFSLWCCCCCCCGVTTASCSNYSKNAIHSPLWCTTINENWQYYCWLLVMLFEITRCYSVKNLILPFHGFTVHVSK